MSYGPLSGFPLSAPESQEEIISASGTATGVSAVAALAVALLLTVGAITGTTTVTGLSAPIAATVATAAGVGADAIVGDSILPSYVGTTTGLSTVSGVGLAARHFADFATASVTFTHTARTSSSTAPVNTSTIAGPHYTADYARAA